MFEEIKQETYKQMHKMFNKLKEIFSETERILPIKCSTRNKQSK